MLQPDSERHSRYSSTQIQAVWLVVCALDWTFSNHCHSAITRQTSFRTLWRRFYRRQNGEIKTLGKPNCWNLGRIFSDGNCKSKQGCDILENCRKVLDFFCCPGKSLSFGNKSWKVLENNLEGFFVLHRGCDLLQCDTLFLLVVTN